MKTTTLMISALILAGLLGTAIYVFNGQGPSPSPSLAPEQSTIGRQEKLDDFTQPLKDLAAEQAKKQPKTVSECLAVKKEQYKVAKLVSGELLVSIKNADTRVQATQELAKYGFLTKELSFYKPEDKNFNPLLVLVPQGKELESLCFLEMSKIGYGEPNQWITGKGN